MLGFLSEFWLVKSLERLCEILWGFDDDSMFDAFSWRWISSYFGAPVVSDISFVCISTSG